MNTDLDLLCLNMSEVDAYNCSHPIIPKPALQAHTASCTGALLLASSIIPPLATATSLSGSAAWHPHLSETPPHPSLLRQAGSPGHTSRPWTPRMIWMIRDRCAWGSCILNSHRPLGNQLPWPPVVQVHLRRTCQPFFENVIVMGKERGLWIVCALQPCGNALYVKINRWEVLFGCPLSPRHRMNVRWKSTGRTADTSHMESTISYLCVSSGHGQHRPVVSSLRV